MSLDRPTFPTVRLTEGYDVEEVDRAVALAQPRIDRSQVEGLRFAPVRMRRGYAMGAVDAWLDEVVAELDRRRGVPAVVPAVTPQPGPEPRPAAADPSPRSQTASDIARAALIIVVVVGAAVWLYVSRF